MMRFNKAGQIEHGHSHPFDHLSLLATGSIELNVDGHKSTFKAPHMIYIQKDKIHELTALEDNTIVYCIHPLRGIESDDILAPEMIPKGINPIAAGIARPVAD
jgi:quercetin dioxygenase-like cupin family protein